MGLFSAIGAAIGIGKGIKKLWYKVKKPVPKVKVSSATAATMGLTSGGLPALAGVGAGAAGMTTALAASSPGGLPVPWWKGPGGKLQLPWSDPRVPEYLKQFALDDAYLKTYYRAPKGYVVVRDNEGRPFAVNKVIAKQFGIWKPNKKPPISVRDWSSFQRAKRVEKKLRKIAGPALRKYSRPTSTKKGKR